MKKTIPGLLLALLLTVSLLTPGALADDGPLVISTPEQLADFRDEVNSGIDYDGKMVVLGGDIDFSLSDFDGRGYAISGLKIDAAAGNADDAYGLFGVIDGATVTNLTLANISIDVENGECVGGVVGLMVNDSTVSNIEMDVGSSISAVRGLGGIVGRMTISGTIENCINEASVSGSGANVGGIVGAAYYTAIGSEMFITDCANYGSIECTAGVTGGIAGLSAANVSGCLNEGTITGSGADVAGIVAEQQNAGSVTNCMNKADITNESNGYGTGGIVGWVRYNGGTTNYPRYEIVEIIDNVNYGKIVGGNDGGGIVGTVYNAAVVTGNENYAESISGTTFAAGIVGNIQNDRGFYSADPDVKIYNNITTTDLNSISANCRDLYAYNNHFTEAAYSVADNGSTWVAQIGAQKYATLAGAMDAAVEAGSATIELLGDITVTKTVELDSTRFCMLAAFPSTIAACAVIEDDTLLIEVFVASSAAWASLRPDDWAARASSPS